MKIRQKGAVRKRMQIVINIPKDRYKRIIEHTEGTYDQISLLTIVENGTPLPEGHGRLIDADTLYPDSDYEDGIFYAVSIGQINSTETIVKAESEKEA